MALAGLPYRQGRHSCGNRGRPRVSQIVSDCGQPRCLDAATPGVLWSSRPLADSWRYLWFGLPRGRASDPPVVIQHDVHAPKWKPLVLEPLWPSEFLNDEVPLLGDNLVRNALRYAARQAPLCPSFREGNQQSGPRYRKRLPPAVRLRCPLPLPFWTRRPVRDSVRWWGRPRGALASLLPTTVVTPTSGASKLQSGRSSLLFGSHR